jgi:outer membrane protein assembly factor BamB
MLRHHALARLTLVAIFLIGSTLSASDWPRFRGIAGSGVSPDKNLPSEIDRTKNVLWSIKVPQGNSSPIVVNNRIFLTAHEGDELIVSCIDANGKELWRKGIPRARTERFHPKNGPTTPTPTTDGQNIFVFFPELGLLAFDFDGKELWRTPIGESLSVQGLAVSPLYVQNKIILAVDTPEQAYVAAFDSKSGKQVWKTEREMSAVGSYATPTEYPRNGQSSIIVVAGAKELTGYDAANGNRIWWARGVTDYPCAPPFVAGDSIYSVEPQAGEWPPFSRPLELFDKNKDGQIEFSELNEGDVGWIRTLKGVDKNAGNRDQIVTAKEYNDNSYGGNAGGLSRIKIGGQGNVGKTHVLWRNTKGMPSLTAVLLSNSVLYAIRDGIFSTYDPETGTLLRQKKLEDASGDYYASPVAGDGKIYLVSLRGKVTVIKEGTDWNILSTGDLAEEVIATPAIANEKIFIRGEQTLFCFGMKKAESAP